MNIIKNIIQKLKNTFLKPEVVRDISKSPFKKPKRRFYLGKLTYGCPYFYPRKFLWCGIRISRNEIKNLRNSSFKLFGFHIYYGYPIYIHNFDLMWKDKFRTPRHEYSPAKYLFFFKWQFVIFYESPG